MPKQSITDKQFKNPDIKRIVRPRPELKYHNRGYDFTEQLRDIEPSIKKIIFEKLYCTKENWPSILKNPNVYIVNDMRVFSNGEFSDLGDQAFCQYIHEWKDINLTKE